MAQICSSQCCVFRANSRKSQKRQTQLQSRQDNSKAEAHLGYANIQKARWMDAAGEGRSRKGIGLWIDSLVPSSISLQREQQAGSDVSGPSLSPGQERQSLTAQWFHILGGDSICYAPETLQRSGIGIFFVILFEYIYKMRVNFLVLFCYISFPLFH